jgi:hypothetical protein
MYTFIFKQKEGVFMQKSNLFFTYLSKLKPQKENQRNDDNIEDVSGDKSIETLKSDNEWLQEYELIYSSYSIDGY